MDQETKGSQGSKPNPAAAGADALVASGPRVAPGEAPAEGPKKEYVVDIFRDWCKGCGICAEFCPKKCIHLNEVGQPVVDRGEGCTGCGWCELHCPDFAICVRELAAKKAEETE